MASNFTDLRLKTALLAFLEDLTGHYIIVPKGSMQAIIDIADPGTLNKIGEAIGLRQEEETSLILDARSPNIHLELKSFRKRHRITQGALAKKAELKQPDISDFERNGTNGFSYDRISRILHAAQALQRVQGKK